MPVESGPGVVRGKSAAIEKPPGVTTAAEAGQHHLEGPGEGGGATSVRPLLCDVPGCAHSVAGGQSRHWLGGLGGEEVVWMGRQYALT
jgi:hypothetical protein